MGTAVARPRCGRPRRRGAGPCGRPAGWGTPHPGEGACKLHGGNARTTHGIFSGVRSESLREAMERHLANPDPLNVLPELAQMRAIFEDYVNRYTENRDALLAWHESWKAGARPLGADRIRRLRDAADELEAFTGEEPPPHSAEMVEGLRQLADDLEAPLADGKPREVLDLASSTVILDRIGKLVGRVEKVNREGWIPRPEFFRIMQEFGRVVKEANTIADPDTRLQTIDAGWKRIFLVD